MEKSWARTEMAGVEVWDQRCRGSLERICEQVLARPEESFSAACGSGLRQAGSRIFGAPQMSVEKILIYPRQSRGFVYEPPKAV